LDLENQRQTILPPASPLPESIASASPTEPAREPELSPAAKAPDA
jgi:hypothetical protein